MCTVFAEILSEPMRAAREAASSLLTTTKGGEIKAELSRSQKALEYQDEFFYIEGGWFASMMGEKGSQILLSKVSGLFDVGGGKKGIQLLEVKQRLEVVCSSALFMFVPEPLQNEISKFSRMVSGLVLGDMPTIKRNATQAITICILFHSFICSNKRPRSTVAESATTIG